MSLNIYLESPDNHTVECVCVHCGHTHTYEERDTLYEANITHNLNHMAEVAGFYRELWRPEECGIVLAGQLVEPLLHGIKRLKSNPDHYRPYSAKNGWGTYEQFIPWLEELLAACEEYSEALVRVSR